MEEHNYNIVMELLFYFLAYLLHIIELTLYMVLKTHDFYIITYPMFFGFILHLF